MKLDSWAKTGTAETGRSAALRPTLEAITDRGRRVVHWLADQRGYSRIYLGGAPTAGLGSPKSDIDIFVVLDSDAPASSEQIDFESDRVDVEFIRLSGLRAMVESASSFSAAADDLRQITAHSRSRMDFLTRFLLGEIIVDDGALAELQKLLKERQGEYLRLLVSRHCVDVQNITDDVVGALLNEDIPSADYQSREALYRAAEAYLASHGDPYVNTKWVWTKWERTVGDRLGEGVRQVLRDAHLPVPGEAVLRNVWLSQDLVAMAATGYAYQPVLSAGPEHCRRTPEYSLIPAADIYLVLRQANEAVSLSRQGVLLWGVSHGRRTQDALVEVQRILDSDGLSVSIDEIEGYYRMLVETGLLVEG
ncbi:hypothetical protein ACFQ8C_29580 [Streptomyces sp. NPDC056503]|uniref:hypothetical protein n=1 Tax=Streptomyces sp. NPDC056503 TaxID=3345842 RepID=UPI00368EA70D